jgi:hypothetical protein
MRIAIRLRADLLRRAKRLAAQEGRSLASLVEDGIRLVLNRSTTKRRSRVVLPVSQATGGLVPGVNLNRSAQLEQQMES